MKSRSLFSRILVGSLFWTSGLLGVAHLLSMTLFRRFHFLARVDHEMLLSIGVVFMVIGLLQVRSGLRPLQALRDRVSAIREGREARVEGTYPAEVQPLVSELNALIEHREQMVARALSKAGDLAHGLKTPLAVLVQEAERAEAEGHAELAAAVSHEVSRMSRQVDYHLAQARAATSGSTPGARCSILDAVNGLSRTLLRLHAGRGVSIETDVPAEHHARGRREDVDEMLGNLLDNACKWARGRVRVASTSDGSDIVITVDDDGPGLEESLREAVLQRGVRADEAAPGSGLGLAIVRDLAELYGGSIALERSPLGGLRATLRLPAG